MDEERAGPGLEAIRVAQRIELLARHELQQGGLDSVLEVVLELRIAPAAERQPVAAECLEDVSQTRIGRSRLCRAQNAEDRFRRPRQHVTVPTSRFLLDIDQ